MGCGLAQVPILVKKGGESPAAVKFRKVKLLQKPQCKGKPCTQTLGQLVLHVLP